MAGSPERGPALPAEEHVYRVILTSSWWVEAENRPSTAAFDDRVFSVEIKTRTTPEESAAKFRDVTRLAEFNCGRAAALEFNSHDERDRVAPDNYAHAHVYFDVTPYPGAKTRKKHIRRLIDICIPIRVTSGSG